MGDRIRKIICKIDDILEGIFELNRDIFSEIQGMMLQINQVYEELLNIIPKLNGIGMEIDCNIVVEQLKRLMQGYNDRDKVLLFDNLGYEIKDTLLFFEDIIKIMNEE